MINVRVIFSHHAVSRRLDEGPIEVRVTVDRRVYYINTGVRCRRNEWRESTMEIVNRQDADVLTDRLKSVVHRIAEEINKCINAGIPLDVADIKRKAWGTVKVPDDMFKWMERQIDDMNVSRERKIHYTAMMRRLREYKKLKRWSDLTVENIIEWDKWLHALRKDRVSKWRRDDAEPLLSDAAVWNYHKTLKAMLNRALLIGKIDRSPYERLKGKFKRGEKENLEFLTDEEMAAFESVKPMPGTRERACRDLFVFQMYTGMSYVDTQAFDISKYQKVDGTWRLTSARIKTGVPFVSQLLPPVVEILEAYDYKTPKIDNSEYNKCLKALAVAAGIQKKLHSHIARHTFATYMLRNGVPIEHVSKMLGHTNITQTQRYAKVMAESVHDDFAMIAEKLKK